MTDSTIVLVKLGVALLGAGALIWRARRTSGASRLSRRLLRDLGLFSALLWWNLLTFHSESYVHTWETYHYYVGAKYFRELGYVGLYECTAVADAEAGLAAAVEKRRIRDLDTNLIGSTAEILRNPGRCTGRFSPPRWRSFKADVGWFRDRMTPTRWAATQLDHGYNATPAWGLVGGLLAATGPASTAQIFALSLLDPLLLALMWGVAWWAFGWEGTCVALIFWGTNYPARFYWTGGAYLRQDWLALTVVGLALLRRERPALAGFALTWAALLRVFPGLILAGLALKAVGDLWSGGPLRLRLAPAHRRLALGSAAALALLVPASSLLAGGLGAWTAFAQNSIKHVSTPLTNNMGLKTLVAYEHASRARLSAPLGLETDPYQVWKEARRRTFAERRVIFAGLVTAFVVLLAWAVRNQTDWAAAILGIGLIPVATELTSYYYAVLLAFGFLWPKPASVGIGLCLLAAVTCLIPQLTGWHDEIHTAISGAVVVFVIGATIAAGASRPTPAASPVAG